MTDSVIKTSSDERVFVIGDLHGIADEPRILFKYLEKKEDLSENDHLVFLGDYIDRGKDSKDVVELMLDLKNKYPNTKFLKGNHEDMLLDFVGYGGRLGHAFLYNGGVETLQSYGISVFSTPDEMVESMPKEHVEFFKNLEMMIQIDDYICVHAGLNPQKEISKQVEEEVLWIRDEFISCEHEFNKTVVFGHTPHQEILLHTPYKIGLDTGLVFGNKLSCLELKSGKLFQVYRSSKDVNVSSIQL